MVETHLTDIIQFSVLFIQLFSRSNVLWCFDGLLVDLCWLFHSFCSLCIHASVAQYLLLLNAALSHFCPTNAFPAACFHIEDQSQTGCYTARIQVFGRETTKTFGLSWNKIWSCSLKKLPRKNTGCGRFLLNEHIFHEISREPFGGTRDL